MTIAKKQLSHVFFTAALVLSFFLLFALRSSLFAPLAFGQVAPEFLVSWRAVNYVPPDYQGKALPSNGSAVEMSFDIIDRNRIVNLANNEVRWFVNGELAASGTGLKRFNFTLQNRRDQAVRIVVVGYNDTELEHTIIIPFTDPEVVIDTKTFLPEANNRNALTLREYVFEAKPFFFNIDNIDSIEFEWWVNDQQIINIPETPEFLVIDLSSQGTPVEAELNINIGIRNLLNRFESSNKNMYFTTR